MIQIYPRNRLPTAARKQIRKDYLVAQAVLKKETEAASGDDDAFKKCQEFRASFKDEGRPEPQATCRQDLEDKELARLREISDAVFEREEREMRQRLLENQREYGLEL